jgi:hypothetical protein
MVPIHPNVEQYFTGEHWLTTAAYGGFLCAFLVWGFKRIYFRYNPKRWKAGLGPGAGVR